MCHQWCSISLVKALVRHHDMRDTACLKVENQPRDISQCSTGYFKNPTAPLLYTQDWAGIFRSEAAALALCWVQKHPHFPPCQTETLQQNCHVRETKETTITYCLLEHIDMPHSSLIMTVKLSPKIPKWTSFLFMAFALPAQEPEWFNSQTMLSTAYFQIKLSFSNVSNLMY